MSQPSPVGRNWPLVHILAREWWIFSEELGEIGWLGIILVNQAGCARSSPRFGSSSSFVLNQTTSVRVAGLALPPTIRLYRRRSASFSWLTYIMERYAGSSTHLRFGFSASECSGDCQPRCSRNLYLSPPTAVPSRAFARETPFYRNMFSRPRAKSCATLLSRLPL